jgi:RNA polymerase sigma-54 factor
MKQSLQLRLSQQLTMTPQLQQAIRLLQLSTMELQTEIQQAVESNPLLEQAEDESIEERDASEGGPDPGQSGAAGQDGTGGSDEWESDDPLGDDVSMDSIPEELPVDSAWGDIYDGPYPTASSSERNGDDYDFQRDISETLRQRLMSQIELSKLNDVERTIAASIVDSIDEDGYLTASLEELQLALQGDDEEPIGLDEVRMVLRFIQHIDAPGIGARNLGECLHLQLEQLSTDTPWRTQAMELVASYLPVLARRDLAQLRRRLRLRSEELDEVLRLIRNLNPRPGSQIVSASAQYIVPDVFVTKRRGHWRVELNSDIAPRLRINPFYESMVRHSDDGETNSYLKGQLQEARWFLKSLRSRNETLLKVATAIAEFQRGFLEHGEVAMKPLVLRDVAEAVDMHESTISRVTTQKYMYTPRGIFEFKYFFSSHVQTSSGGECSATAIRAMIRRLVEAENASKPLSDSKIATILVEQGIQVARRTVAKYRESMAILPSNERRRLI